MEANKSISNSYIITQKSPETYFNSDELCQLSLFSDILDSVKENKHLKDDPTFKNQLKIETKKWLHLPLNKRQI